MWRALRAELAYMTPWLLGGLGIAVGVVVLMNVVFLAVGKYGPPGHMTAGLRGMFLIMAPIIVGYIAQAGFTEERRARLLLATPLTPRQLAGVTVLLPACLFGIGVLAAGLATGADSLLTGAPERDSLHLIAYVGVLMFVVGQIVLLAQEATAAQRQRRVPAAVAGWVGFVVTVVLMAALLAAALWSFPGWATLVVGHLVVGALAMAASVALYVNRTDFTR